MSENKPTAKHGYRKPNNWQEVRREMDHHGGRCRVRWTDGFRDGVIQSVANDGPIWTTPPFAVVRRPDGGILEVDKLHMLEIPRLVAVKAAKSAGAGG